MSDSGFHSIILVNTCHPLRLSIGLCYYAVYTAGLGRLSLTNDLCYASAAGVSVIYFLGVQCMIQQTSYYRAVSVLSVYMVITLYRLQLSTCLHRVRYACCRCLDPRFRSQPGGSRTHKLVLLLLLVGGIESNPGPIQSLLLGCLNTNGANSKGVLLEST